MTKPSSPAAWATDATYTTGPVPGDPTKVAPDPAKVAQGFHPDEKPAAETFNHRLNLLGQWTSWLDGLFDGADTLTVPALEVTGDAEVGGLAVTGDAHVGDDLVVADDASVGGDLAVTGAIASEGEVYRGASRTLIVPAALASDPAGTTSKLSSAIGAHSGWALVSTAKVTYPLPLDVGDHIKGWTLHARKTSNASGTLYGSLYHVPSTNVDSSPIATDSSSANNPGNITLGATGLDIPIAAGVQWYLVVGSDAAGGGDRAFHAEIRRSHPKP